MIERGVNGRKRHANKRMSIFSFFLFSGVEVCGYGVSKSETTMVINHGRITMR